MTQIQLLSDDVITRIAAGEVVERPASVVKELIENALDAQATYIHIEVGAGGRRSIRVSDDGIGIRNDEVDLAFKRHATSKLRSIDDLNVIATLGFRGEALASIAAVSRLTLVTRHRDEDVGVQIQLNAGELNQRKSVGAPAGTVITVENLFFNTPARLKFLKSEATEKRNINAIVMNYAMAYPAIRFILAQDGREIFRSPGSGQLADVVVKVFGLDTFREMLAVSGQERIRETGGMIHIDGFVSLPEMNRKDRSRIILFVNGRAIRDTSLTYAVTQAYHSLMDKSRHPYAVLMIQMPSDFVDVNVHPTKAEVRFQDTNTVFSALQRTVRQAVIGYAQSQRHIDYQASHDEEKGWVLPYEQQQMEMELDAEDYLESTSSRVSDPTAIPEGIGRPDKPRTLPLMRVVGQVGAAYIVAEGPAGMYLIDQFAAHTRILFHELTLLREQGNPIPHRVLASQTLDLSKTEAHSLEKHLDALAEVGFVVEPFGTNTFLIRGIPAVLASGDPAQHVWSTLETLALPPPQTRIDRLLILIAERAAIKSGQVLTMDEMRSLVQKLERCPDPLVSPSGQATLIHMSADQLQREFLRSQS